jgi:hypothetical protein
VPEAWPVPPLSAHAANRAALIANGFLGGYTKVWVTPVFESRQESIGFELYEFESTEAAAAWAGNRGALRSDLGGHRLTTHMLDDEYGVTALIGIGLGEGPMTCSMMLVLNEPQEVAEDFANGLATAQQTRLRELVPALVPR